MNRESGDSWEKERVGRNCEDGEGGEGCEGVAVGAGGVGESDEVADCRGGRGSTEVLA